MKVEVPVLALAAALGLGRGDPSMIPHETDPAPAVELAPTPRISPVRRADRVWQDILSPEQFRVMRRGGTEPPFSGRFDRFFEPGGYACAACGLLLFRSEAKYDAGCGWPSFRESIGRVRLELRDDYSARMRRVEVRCAACGAHLGHVFADGPPPGGERYCLNSVSLAFIPDRPGGSSPDPGESPARPGPSAAPERRAGDESGRGPAPPPRETATFSAGCFWGVEHQFRRLPGVVETQVGYTGGTAPRPTYEQVCSDATGHAESVEVVFDPGVVTYEDLVRFFFRIHDPTQVDRQGPDIGSQYRSAIFYRDEEQKRTAEKVRAEMDASGRYKARVATAILPAAEFYRAEEYHQRYYEKRGRK